MGDGSGKMGVKIVLLSASGILKLYLFAERMGAGSAMIEVILSMINNQKSFSFNN